MDVQTAFLSGVIEEHEVYKRATLELCGIWKGSPWLHIVETICDWI